MLELDIAKKAMEIAVEHLVKDIAPDVGKAELILNEALSRIKTLEDTRIVAEEETKRHRENPEYREKMRKLYNQAVQCGELALAMTLLEKIRES